MRLTLMCVFVLASLACTTDPYIGTGLERCGCGVDNHGRETFACLVDDGEGASISTAGYCADGYRCSVEPLAIETGDRVDCERK